LVYLKALDYDQRPEPRILLKMVSFLEQEECGEGTESSQKVNFCDEGVDSYFQGI
jgi:hypothetical protein